MFTVADRERIRSELLAFARTDPHLTGGALTGSAAAGAEDQWSDIDLAFGVAEAAEIPQVLSNWTSRLYQHYGALHHFDVHAGAWTYRVFLLANTLQVDLAFAPAGEFGARAPTFRLIFGRAAERPHVIPPSAESLIGNTWLYAIHARSSIARGRPWQAEYMVSAMRDHVLALACLRLGAPVREGRGMDLLAKEVTQPLEEALVRRIDRSEISRALGVVSERLLVEMRMVDEGLASRLEPAIRELSSHVIGNTPG